MKRFSFPLILLLAGAAPLALASGTQLALTAIVAKFARVGVHEQPSALVVNEADVARGYVEVRNGARLELKSNSREGMRLDFLSGLPGEIVRAIEVTGLPSGALSSGTLMVGYRIILSAQARPGVYPWPVQVVATPL